MDIKNTLIFCDVEGHGPAPMLNDPVSFEFGAVEYNTGAAFHGKGAKKDTFEDFDEWLGHFPYRYVFVSDNPAYDWQFINYYFHLFLGRNPFGHSARRIGDFYAGLTGSWGNTQRWKELRVTPHDHNPVHDARGNAEALRRILGGER